MLAHDLVRTIKNPFESLDKRRKRIWIYSFLMVVLMCPYWLLMSLLASNGILPIPQCGDFRFEYITKPFEAIVLLVYFCYILYAIIFAAKALFRKGMN